MSDKTPMEEFVWLLAASQTEWSAAGEAESYDEFRRADKAVTDFVASLIRERDEAREALDEIRTRKPSMDDIAAVEEVVGMGCGAWDQVNPMEIVEAAWNLLRPSTPHTETPEA